MKIFVITKPNAKESKIEKVNENHFKVWVDEEAKEGKANEKLIEILADYFGVSKSQVKIVSGFKSKKKIIEIF